MTMYVYTTVLAVLLFAVSSQSCSLPRGTPSLSVAARTVLAPLVIYGRVLNISTTTRLNVYYKACVQVLEVIKGDTNIPREMCFGNFGGDYLCLTDVYEQKEYIFYLNEDRTARYKDGIPTSAILANVPQIVEMAKSGYCHPNRSQSRRCDRPSINRQVFKGTVQVQEGDDAHLNCFGNGTQPIVVSWRKIGDDRRPVVGTAFHTIKRVTVSDMGVYECTLHNPAGMYRTLVRLNVGAIPCGAYLHLKPGQQSVIQSPNHPRSYPFDKMCSWRLCPSPGQRVKLDFDYFDLSRSISDNLQIRQECVPVRSGSIRHCARTSPGKLVSSCKSRCVQVWFNSNLDGNGNSAKGFHAIVTSTEEEAMMFDYDRLYCDNQLLLRFTPKKAYFSSMTGRVLDNYKNSGPLPGQEITINIDSTITDLYGCFARIKERVEYYIGADVSGRSYTLKFVMRKDSTNKPTSFDNYINKFKTEPRDCRATQRPPGKTSQPVNPPTDQPPIPDTPASPVPTA